MATVYQGTGTKIARIAGKSDVMTKAAEKVCKDAQANATARFNTGEFSQNFKVATVPGQKGVKDRVVYNDYPGAVAIELGHFAYNGKGERGKFVPAQFNLASAVAANAT